MGRLLNRDFAHSVCPRGRNELAFIAYSVLILAILLLFPEPWHVKDAGSRRPTHSGYPAGRRPHLQPGARETRRPLPRALRAAAKEAGRGRIYRGLCHAAERIGDWAADSGLRPGDPR